MSEQTVAVEGARSSSVVFSRRDVGDLLSKSLALARKVRDTKGYGWWADTLVFLRIAAAMRLHGLEVEAMTAIRDCVDHNTKINDGALKDEISIELCRILVLLGEMVEARKLAATVAFRNYDLVAFYTIASTALKKNDLVTAEEAIRSAISIVDGRKEGEEKHGDDLWLRGFVRMTSRREQIGLSRELVSGMKDDFWKSGALGDLGEVLAMRGEVQEALRVVQECPDQYMAVLGYARIGCIFHDRGHPDALAEAVARLLQLATDVSGEEARDAALRIAAQKLAAAGADAEASRVAAEIRDPCMGFLARCVLLSPDNFDELAADLQLCPDAEKPLMVEALTVACGAKGMRSEALKVSDLVAPGWPRLRALCEAARWLTDKGEEEEAATLLDRAEGETGHIEDAGWRCLAHIQLAARYHRVGREEAVDVHLKAADTELSKVEDPEDCDSLVPRLVEAALEAEQCPLAREIILKMLKPDIEGELRDRLVPMLVQAGDFEAALSECSRKPLQEAFARRLVAYRLLEIGERALALEYAAGLPEKEYAETLSDISLISLRTDHERDDGPKAIGVTLHGSWRSWFPRLERLGLPWELMPFLEPFELGGEGLTAQYSMLGFPGTGSHIYHVSLAGVEGLREYLYDGGGFFGICAGQFLATKCQFVPTREVYHPRGEGPHQVQVVKQHPISFTLPPVVTIPRMNGGFLEPVQGCEVVGWYDTVERYAALAAANYGLGRVVVFSPHPEGSSDFIPRDRLCISAMYWILGGMP